MGSNVANLKWQAQ